jgi:hypothetical protein
VKQNYNRHYLTHAQAASLSSFSAGISYQNFLPFDLKLFPEIVNFTKNLDDFHGFLGLSWLSPLFT